MEIAIIIALIVLSVILAINFGSHSTSVDKFPIEAEKSCPPHQWQSQDLVDKEGNKHGQRIVCKICGPRLDSEDT